MSGVTFLDPGSLRHRVTIEAVSNLSDGLGGSVEAWSEWRTVWAHIEPIRVDLRERASQTDELVSHRVHLRQPLEVTSEMRLRKGARIFDIETIHDPDETRRYWLLIVREQGQ